MNRRRVSRSAGAKRDCLTTPTGRSRTARHAASRDRLALTLSRRSGKAAKADGTRGARPHRRQMFTAATPNQSTRPLTTSREHELFEPHQPAAGRDLDRFRAAGDAELVEEMSEVGLDRPLADVQRAGNLLVRLALGPQPERRPLARRGLPARDAFPDLRP